MIYYIYISNGIFFFVACDFNRTSSSTPCLTTGSMILERYQLHEVNNEFLAYLKYRRSYTIN